MDLFDKADVITCITADKAVVGTKGYFGDCLQGLITAVEHNNVQALLAVYETEVYCFKNEHGQNYNCFLPANKVRKTTYRPIKNIKELFAFMMADGNEYSEEKMVDTLMGQRYVLKSKLNNAIKYHTVNSLYIESDGMVTLDYLDLDDLFDYYEFKKGDKFVPFGVKEEIKNE